MTTNWNEDSMTQGDIETVLRLGGIRVTTEVRAGGLTTNHNQPLQVRTNLKAGYPPGPSAPMNHNQTLRVKSNVKAGSLTSNHNQPLCVKSNGKAGGVIIEY